MAVAGAGRAVEPPSEDARWAKKNILGRVQTTPASLCCTRYLTTPLRHCRMATMHRSAEANVGVCRTCAIVSQRGKEGNFDLPKRNADRPREGASRCYYTPGSGEGDVNRRDSAVMFCM